MYVKQIDRSTMTPAYGAAVCRLLDHLPISGHTGFGCSVVEVAPGGAVVQHSHAEHELWILMSGSGEVDADADADGDVRTATALTMIYMRPHEPHAVRNVGQGTDLVFLAIWWD